MYHDRYSESFGEQKKSPRFRNLAKAMESKCKLILQAPYSACKSEPLKYEWARKRSGHLTEQLRIIYKICEECRKRGEEEPNHMVACLPCEGVPDDTVNFLTIVDYHC